MPGPSMSYGRPTSEKVNPEQIKIDSFCPFRWWAIEDLMQSDELFVPGKLGRHLHTLLQQGPPAKPFVVGV